MRLYELVAKKIKKQKELSKSDPALFVQTLFSEEVDNELSLPDKINKRLSLETQKGIPHYLQKTITNEEREEFRNMLDSRDVDVIKTNFNNIFNIESEYESQGHGIVEEILSDKKKLPILSHFYIDANLYNRGNLKNDWARAMTSNQVNRWDVKKDEDGIKERIDKHIAPWGESILAGQKENTPKY